MQLQIGKEMQPVVCIDISDETFHRTVRIIHFEKSDRIHDRSVHGSSGVIDSFRISAEIVCS